MTETEKLNQDLTRFNEETKGWTKQVRARCLPDGSWKIEVCSTDNVVLPVTYKDLNLLQRHLRYSHKLYVKDVRLAVRLRELELNGKKADNVTTRESTGPTDAATGQSAAGEPTLFDGIAGLASASA